MRGERAWALLAAVLSVGPAVVIAEEDPGGVESSERSESVSESVERVAQRAEDIAAQEEAADQLPATQGPHGAAEEAPEITPSDVISDSGVFGAIARGVDTSVAGVDLRLYWTRGISPAGYVFAK